MTCYSKTCVKAKKSPRTTGSLKTVDKRIRGCVRFKRMTHQCIKPGCSTRYETTDPDPYYCPSCDQARKAIAAEIDKKLAGRTRPVKSDFQTFEEQAQTYKTPDGRTISFMRVKL